MLKVVPLIEMPEHQTPLYVLKIGSTLYGLTTPTSDVDMGAIILEGLPDLFGLFPVVPSETSNGVNDFRRYTLRKFVYMLLKANPNVVEWLFANPEAISLEHEAIQEIKANKHVFLGAEDLVKSHMGFADSQVYKMKNREYTPTSTRLPMIAEYGYDLKYASHALRLLLQLEELLTTANIVLPYKKEIYDMVMPIKTGKVSFEDFLSTYDETKERVSQITDIAFSQKADEALASKIVQGIHERLLCS